MAPFKLKFRMGSGSRSTSQENEEPVQQPLLTRQSSICDSSTTIDSEFTSMSSTNDQHNLLPNKFDEETGTCPNAILSGNEQLFHGLYHILATLAGYENPAIMRTITDSRCYQNAQTSNASHSAEAENVSPVESIEMPEKLYQLKLGDCRNTNSVTISAREQLRPMTGLRPWAPRSFSPIRFSPMEIYWSRMSARPIRFSTATIWRMSI